MAAAMIPIITAAIPLLQPLVSSLVLHVESLFGHKTGKTKFDNVFATIQKVVTDLATGGKIPGTLDDASIASLIESVVQELKNQGVLTPESAASLVGSNSVQTGSGNVKITGGSITLGK